ncbi:hypothetical protein N7445_001715 [Penicillium cf. griseofulvum]|nr:hypothetical protein N7445_001715 [Penicillium cf. griseofulvum]
MSTLRSYPAYEWYLTQSKSTAEGAWPVMTRNASNEWIVYPGEKWCRYPGCLHPTTFGDTNKLKHHITKKHMGTGDSMARSSGGSPSLVLLREANDIFYQVMYIRFEQLHAGDSEHRPTLPFKRNGEVNATEMRLQLREMGHTGACASCKADSAARSCCTNARREKCDYFEYFSEEDSEEGNEEGNNYGRDGDTEE